MKSILIVVLWMFVNSSIQAQLNDNTFWRNKRCAVVLTYDDALDVHLDHVIPQLDSSGFKGTFYLTGKSVSLN